MGVKRILAALIAALLVAAAVNLPGLAQRSARDAETKAVIELLAQIDSLQEMQDKKIVHTNAMNEFNLRKPYCTYTGNGYNGDGTVNVDNSAEHIAKQQLYAEYVENMFALRA